MSSNELVLCVRSESVNELKKEWFTCKPNISLDEFNALFAQEEITVMSRKYAEKDENFLQFIPSCVFRKPDGTILLYQRTKGTGESRLLGNHSCNVGGHVNVTDIALERDEEQNKTGALDLAGTIWNNIFREVEEELGIDLGSVADLNFDEDFAEFYGFIYDSSNSVGQVHLGLLFIFDVKQDLEFDSLIAESEGMLLKGWYNPFHLLKLDESKEINLENWANIVCEQLVRNHS